MFCLITSSKLSPQWFEFSLKWRWRWWDWIQAIFLNIFYFNSKTFLPITKSLVFKSKCWFCFCVGVASVLLGKIKLKFSLFFKSNIFCLVKFIYSEKATKFWEIFTLLLSYVVLVKSKVKISQNFVAFSEYMNFIFLFIVIMRKYGKAISCFRKRQSQNVLSSRFPNLVLLHISFKAYDSPQSGAISCFRKLLCFNCRTYFQSFLILVKRIL